MLRPHPRVRFAAHVDGGGAGLLRGRRGSRASRAIVAKLRRSRYEPGRRSPAWLKIKVRPEQELVVGGWTPGEGNARDLGAVAVGVYEGERLRFAARSARASTAGRGGCSASALEPLETDAPPFDPPPPRDYRGRWGGDLDGRHLGRARSW